MPRVLHDVERVALWWNIVYLVTSLKRAADIIMISAALATIFLLSEYKVKVKKALNVQ